MAFLFLLVVLVGGPLAYALGTLRGLRSKWVYLLLRLRKPDGQLLPYTVVKAR
ncbi:MAG: hypothetical protein ACREI3_08535 [Nitrospirales bacterium]